MTSLADLAPRWPRLNALLDVALELPPEERAVWLARLEGEPEALKDTLRRLLEVTPRAHTTNFLSGPPSLEIATDGSAVGALAEGMTVGPYRLLRVLGRGGMGEVWLAERADGLLQRTVALKLPHLSWAPGLAQRFARERTIVASLEHPRIARLYDAGLDPAGRPWMALEYVEGEPIDAYVHRRGLGVPERLALLMQVAEAVAYAHSRLVLHRDLKPSNILVTAAGEVRLLDFGVAKLMQDDEAGTYALTQEAGRMLTPQYASPEQILGRPLSTASDVYSLGVVAYEVLAGAPPYRLEARAGFGLDQAILQADPPPASSLAESEPVRRALRGNLDATLAQALRPEPTQRYPSIEALAADWRRHLEGEAVSARADTALARFGRLLRRWRRELLAGAAIALAFWLGVGLGATALVLSVFALGLGAALWQAREAARARDRALRMIDRLEAVNLFMNALVTDAVQAGEAMTAEQVVQRSQRLIEQELKDSPGAHASVLSMIGAWMHTLGRLDQAIKHTERSLVLARGAADPELRDELIVTHANAQALVGKVEEARTALRAVLARPSLSEPRRSEAHYCLSTIASNNNEPAEALLHAQQALDVEERRRRPRRKVIASMRAQLGDALSLNGRLADADREFGIAFEMVEQLGYGRSAQAMTMLNNWAVVNERAGDARRALALCDRARGLEPADYPSPFVACNRARALESIGRWQDALTAYREAVTISMRREVQAADWTARLGVASVMLHLGHVDEARVALSQLDERPPIPPTHQIRASRLLVEGRIALVDGEPAAAERAFAQAISIAPGYGSALLSRLGLAAAYEAQGRGDEALSECRAALEAAVQRQGGKPHSFRSALAGLAVGRLLKMQGREAEAAPVAQAALVHAQAMLDPGHPAIAELAELASLTAPAQASPDAAPRSFG